MGKPVAERARWTRAAFIHDAVRDAPVEELAKLSGNRWDLPKLYHGPAAAVLAAEHGETDEGVLSAIRFHSVGYAVGTMSATCCTWRISWSRDAPSSKSATPSSPRVFRKTPMAS